MYILPSQPPSRYIRNTNTEHHPRTTNEAARISPHNPVRVVREPPDNEPPLRQDPIRSTRCAPLRVVAGGAPHLAVAWFEDGHDGECQQSSLRRTSRYRLRRHRQRGSVRGQWALPRVG